MNLFISVVTDEYRTGSYLGDVSALPQRLKKASEIGPANVYANVRDRYG